MKGNILVKIYGMMRSAGVVQLFILTLIVITFASCEKDKGPVVVKPKQVIDTTSTVPKVSYRNYIQPLFNDYCIACHHSSHPFLDLRGVVSYDELLFTGANAPYVDSTDTDNALLIQRLIGDEWPVMPPDPPYFTEAQIDSVRLWMQQGFSDN